MKNKVRTPFSDILSISRTLYTVQIKTHVIRHLIRACLKSGALYIDTPFTLPTHEVSGQLKLKAKNHLPTTPTGKKRLPHLLFELKLIIQRGKNGETKRARTGKKKVSARRTRSKFCAPSEIGSSKFPRTREANLSLSLSRSASEVAAGTKSRRKKGPTRN